MANENEGALGPLSEIARLNAELPSTIEERPAFPVEQLAMALEVVAMRDPEASLRVLQSREPCGLELRAHPDVPVDEHGRVGMLGLLNGALAEMGCMHRVAFEIDDITGELRGFAATLPEYTGQTLEQCTL